MPEDTSHNKPGISGITKEIRRYIEARLELFILTLSEQLALLIADSVRILVGTLLLAGGFFFAWFALGFYLSQLFENYAIGFLISSVPLLFAGLIFLSMKSGSLLKNVQAKVMGRVMNSLNQYKEPGDDQESGKDIMSEGGE